MVKVSEDSAAKFINALIKSVQTLCHGYLEFSNGIQIIGHINLSVDEGTSLDYILKEKVCKNAENSTLFISNSFHAEPKSEPEVSGKNPVNQRTPENQEESGRVGSAISSISSALTSSREKRKTGTKDSDNLHSHQNSGKRKASDDADHRPPKVTSHHDNSSASQSPYHSQSSPLETKEALRSKLRTASEMDMAESETLLPQTAGISGDSAADIGVNLAGSVLEPVDDQGGDLPGRDDDSDGDLEVTFIKEEFVEGERSACEYGNTGPFIGSHQRASEGMTDPSLYPVSLHSSSTYVPSAHDFQPGPSTSQSGSSSMRGSVSQQLAVQPLPPGTKPACGYVHPSDAQKWMTNSSFHWQGNNNSRGKLPSPSTSHRFFSGSIGGGGNEVKNVSKEELEALVAENLSITEMASRLSVSRPTMYKLLKKHGLESAFRYITNEQIIETMKKVVAECPEALKSLSLMKDRLGCNSKIDPGPLGFMLPDKRLISCMKNLQLQIQIQKNI